jgi:hypothetical protein
VIKIEEIIKQLDNADENQRLEAVHALQTLNSPDAVSALLSKLETEPVESVRLAIVNLLGKLGNLDAVARLEALLWSNISGSLKYEVELALKQIEKTSIPIADSVNLSVDFPISDNSVFEEDHQPAEVLIEWGIEAARNLQRDLAALYLRAGVQLAPYNEQAWLWLSLVVDSDEEQLISLDNVLWINKDNPHANRMLRQMIQEDKPDSKFYTDGARSRVIATYILSVQPTLRCMKRA